MKKSFILLALVATGANIIAQGSDTIRNSDRALAQPQSLVIA